MRLVRTMSAAAAAAMLFACGDGRVPEPSPSPSPSPSTSTSAPQPTAAPEPVWPLTGLPAASEPGRPALVVKIDNTAAASPQLGLSSADLVVEELVEGGKTRLAAMFHATTPGTVGPVRSVRTTDIGIVLPAGGVLVASGGAGRVLDALDEAGVRVLAEGDSGFFRAPERRAPYNLMLDAAAAAASLDAGSGRPGGPYLPWGPPPQGRAVAEVDVVFSGSHTTRWSWSGGTWHRRDGLAAAGDEFLPATLLVLHVTTRDAGYTDPAGNPVPETVLEGGGAALLLAGGEAVEGRWSKAALGAPLRLSHAGGRPLKVPAGRTWIELVPEAGSVDLR